MRVEDKDIIEKAIYTAYTLSSYSTALQRLLAMGEDEQQLDLTQNEVLSLFLFIEETSKSIQKDLNTLLDSIMTSNKD